MRVAVSNMYAEFTKILSRAGVDPRDFALVAFGGAGPVVGASSPARSASRPCSCRARRGRCARSARISADIVNDAVRTVHAASTAMPTGAGALRGAALRALEARRSELAAWLAQHGAGSDGAAFRPARTCATSASPTRSRCRSIRPGSSRRRAPRCSAAFHRAHERAFGHADREAPAEIVNLRVQLRATRPRVPLRRGRRRRGVAGAAREARGSGSTAAPPRRGRVRARRPRRAARA